MKKVTYEKWCAGFVQNLASHMNLGGWEITVEFSPVPKQGSEGCYAHIDCDSTYMQATMVVFPLGREDFEARNMERLVRVLTHELAHILIDPLHEHMVPFLSDTTRPFFTNDMENVTQRIAMVLVKSLPKHIIPPR